MSIVWILLTSQENTTRAWRDWRDITAVELNRIPGLPNIVRFAVARNLTGECADEDTQPGDFMDLSTSQTVFLVAIALFTVATAWTDLRSRKVLNTMTLPMWIAGWIWQLSFHGRSGLWDGLCGFGIGFGVLFVLWMVGSAGGGDVKLLGALSVWLGPGLTLKVMLASLVFVILGTTAVVLSSMLTRGWRGTKRRFGRETENKGGNHRRKPGETIAARQKRRVMAFAMPVAIATWSVLLLFREQW